MKRLLESLQADKSREVTNEPKRIACGAPDYVIARRTSFGADPVGHIEAVEPGTEDGKQFTHVREFHIGGYQVAEKWLKDRKGRVLTYDDRDHYKRIIAALGETASIMQRIDSEIQDWPIVLRYEN